MKTALLKELTWKFPGNREDILCVAVGEEAARLQLPGLQLDALNFVTLNGQEPVQEFTLGDIRSVAEHIGAENIAAGNTYELRFRSDEASLRQVTVQLCSEHGCGEDASSVVDG